MKEKSANPALKMALQNLPKYEPSTEIWATLDKELDFQKGIQTLPDYSPSEAIWEQIEAELPRKTNTIFWLKRLSIAASFLLFIGIFLLKESTLKNNEQLTYQQEEIDLSLLVADWEDEDALTSQIEALCTTQRYLCTAPEFTELQQELTELETAKLELKTAIENYGKDVELIAQLSEIELERTGILKKMVAQIL